MTVKASSNVSTLGPRMKKMATAIEKGSKATVNAAALQSKKIIEKQRDADTGGDGRLSGVGRSGAKLGVSYKLEGTASNPRAFMRATGPWPLIENNTTGRVIRPKRVAGASRRGFVGPVAPGQFSGSRRAVLNIPGIGYRRSARHPGTKGKKTFAKGRAAAAVPAAEIVRKRTNAIVKAGFFG
jgi:hypothetical protein